MGGGVAEDRDGLRDVWVLGQDFFRGLGGVFDVSKFFFFFGLYMSN